MFSALERMIKWENSLPPCPERDRYWELHARLRDCADETERRRILEERDEVALTLRAKTEAAFARAAGRFDDAEAIETLAERQRDLRQLVRRAMDETGWRDCTFSLAEAGLTEVCVFIRGAARPDESRRRLKLKRELRRACKADGTRIRLDFVRILRLGDEGF